MSEREFEWDVGKEALNVRKHGIGFEEAATVFDDPKAIWKYDAVHSMAEDREILIGVSRRFRILMVVAVERHDTTRIISARKANAAEARLYESQD